MNQTFCFLSLCFFFCAQFAMAQGVTFKQLPGLKKFYFDSARAPVKINDRGEMVFPMIKYYPNNLANVNLVRIDQNGDLHDGPSVFQNPIAGISPALSVNVAPDGMIWLSVSTSDKINVAKYNQDLTTKWTKQYEHHGIEDRAGFVFDRAGRALLAKDDTCEDKLLIYLLDQNGDVVQKIFKTAPEGSCLKVDMVKSKQPPPFHYFIISKHTYRSANEFYEPVVYKLAGDAVEWELPLGNIPCIPFMCDYGVERSFIDLSGNAILFVEEMTHEYEKETAYKISPDHSIQKVEVVDDLRRKASAWNVGDETAIDGNLYHLTFECSRQQESNISLGRMDWASEKLIPVKAIQFQNIKGCPQLQHLVGKDSIFVAAFGQAEDGRAAMEMIEWKLESDQTKPFYFGKIPLGEDHPIGVPAIQAPFWMGTQSIFGVWTSDELMSSDGDVYRNHFYLRLNLD